MNDTPTPVGQHSRKGHPDRGRLAPRSEHVRGRRCSRTGVDLLRRFQSGCLLAWEARPARAEDGRCQLPPPCPSFRAQPSWSMWHGPGAEKAKKGHCQPMGLPGWGTVRDVIPQPPPGPGKGGLPAHPGTGTSGRGHGWAQHCREDLPRTMLETAVASHCSGSPCQDGGDHLLSCSRPMGLWSSFRSWGGKMPPNACRKYPDIAESLHAGMQQRSPCSGLKVLLGRMTILSR